MKKLFSSKYSPRGINTAMFILRVSFGILMFYHGFQKITHFETTSQHMPNLMGMGITVNTSLIIFAEFFCSLLIILGLFTRLACVPIIIGMGVAVYKAHEMDVFAQGQLAALFLIGFIVILLIGPGKVSVDQLIN